MAQFATTLDKDEIHPRPDLDRMKATDTSVRRHVQILKHAANSHRRAGQIYLQDAEREQG